MLREILQRAAAEVEDERSFDGLRVGDPQRRQRSQCDSSISDGDLFARGQRVVGIIDFGDIVHSYMIGDLAVAIAYAILGKRDPLGVAAASLPVTTRCSR